jgi:hypothetical protein
LIVSRWPLKAAARAGEDPARYRRLAIAALKPLVMPSKPMIDAAHQAVWFEAFWGINSRRDFRRAVRAMITYAINEGQGAGAGRFVRTGRLCGNGV